MKTIPPKFIQKKSALLIVLFLGSTMTLFQNFTSGGAVTNPTVDPWNAPVGDPVQGVTLFDGWQDLRVLPAPVNVVGGWTDSAAISNNGKSLYFTYSQIDAFQYITYKNMVVNGPTRTGMTALGMKNFRADLTSTGWVVNYLPDPINSPDYNFADCSLSPNADENLLVFARSTVTPSGKSQLYYSVKSAGVWSIPAAIPSPVNSGICNDDNGFVIGSAATGADLYFESDRADAAGTSCGTNRHIFYTHYDPGNGGSFSPVQKVSGINGAGANDSDTQPFFSQDKTRAYWTALRGSPFYYGVVTADRQPDGSYANTRPIATPTISSPYTGKVVLLGEANIVELPQGSLMYMICGIAQSELNGKPYNTQLSVCVARKPRAPVGINTTAGWSVSPSISRDGQRLYFNYSRYDFGTWIKSQGTILPKATGPDRPNLRKSMTNPFEETDIYMSTLKADGKWTEPVSMGFNGPANDSNGMETNNGNTFIWMQSNGVSNNVVISNKNMDGTWSTPQSISSQMNLVLPGVTQDDPRISPDGKHIWFTSNRPGGLGGKDIWHTYNVSTVTSPAWIQPGPMANAINTSGDEYYFWISPVTNEMYWNGSGGIRHCSSNGANCINTPSLITIPGCSAPMSVSMPDDGGRLYFSCADLTTFKFKIMYSIKQSDGSWGPAIAVD